LCVLNTKLQLWHVFFNTLSPCLPRPTTASALYTFNYTVNESYSNWVLKNTQTAMSRLSMLHSNWVCRMSMCTYSYWVFKTTHLKYSNWVGTHTQIEYAYLLKSSITNHSIRILNMSRHTYSNWVCLPTQIEYFKPLTWNTQFEYVHIGYSLDILNLSVTYSIWTSAIWVCITTQIEYALCIYRYK